MSKLNRFIINSDYDSLKIVNQISWTVSVPSVTLEQQDGPTYNYNFTVPNDVYFDVLSVKHSNYPNSVATGTTATFSVLYDSGNTIAQYEVTCGKTSATNYRIRVKVNRIWGQSSPATTTFGAVTLTIKLNLLVPSEQ